MDKEILDLLKSKYNYSHWAGDYPLEFLESGKYYKIPISKSQILFKTEGYYYKLNKINKIVVFTTVEGKICAQVTIFPEPKFAHTKFTNPDITTATYLIEKDRIVVLNHFDAIGVNHTNNYDFYSKDTKPLYEKYFTDRVVVNNNEKHFISNAPHFHFHSAEQTKNFNNQQLSNSISIKCLIKYIKDLKSSTEKDVLQRHSLNMPFLEYLKNPNLEYISQLQIKVQQILNSNSTKVKDEKIKQTLTDIINKYKFISVDSNLDKILLDLYTLKDIIENLHNNTYLIASISNSFISSVNNIKTATSTLELN